MSRRHASGRRGAVVGAILLIIILGNAIVLHRSISRNNAYASTINENNFQNKENDESFPSTNQTTSQVTDKRDLYTSLPPLSHLASLPQAIDPASCHQSWTTNTMTDPQNLNRRDKEGLAISKIPHIVHQTAKSACVTPSVAQAMAKWKYPGWSYVLHPDEAVQSLLRHTPVDEFPHLARVAQFCLPHGTLMADLWRYVVLWHYGGIYVDIDAVPAAFDPAIHLTDDMEALFVVEQYHILSQWFMAVRPHHPLMYYAVHECLVWLMGASDTGAAPPSVTTGPHALHRALIKFVKDAGGNMDPLLPGMKPVRAGTYRGTANATITVIGSAANQNEYVNRDILMRKKFREYEKMGMRHFSEDKKHPTNRSCLSLLAEHQSFEHRLVL